MKNYADLNKTEANWVAKKLLEVRPITTTFELRDNIVGLFQKAKTKKIAQVFQGLRIATNHELYDLKVLCEKLDTIMAKNGLCMFITFHSLERKTIQKVLTEKKKFFSRIKIERPSEE